MSGSIPHRNGSNGHLNGGAGGVPRKHPMRGELRMLQSLVAAGQIAADQLPDVLKQAEAIAHSAESIRDRNAAMALIGSIARAGADAAVSLDKIDRLDSGQDTERVAYRISMPEARR